MGKTVTPKTKPGRPQRHDPLHVELGSGADQDTLRKPTRKKFVDRNSRDENKAEVATDSVLFAEYRLTIALTNTWIQNCRERF